MSLSRACKRYACRSCTDPACVHSCHPVEVEQPSLLAGRVPWEPPVVVDTRAVGLAVGQALKEEGMARVDANADAAWREKATAALTYLIDKGDTFTSDDVWALLEAHYPHLSTSNPKVMGALINGAAKTGRIIRVGYALTTRPVAHARPVAQWRKA